MESIQNYRIDLQFFEFIHSYADCDPTAFSTLGNIFFTGKIIIDNNSKRIKSPDKLLFIIPKSLDNSCHIHPKLVYNHNNNKIITIEKSTVKKIF